MPATDPDHPLDLVECQRKHRHVHPYSPPDAVAPRCPKGHRGPWRIKLGGPIPLTVNCGVCAQQNRTATAYERGQANALARAAADRG